MNNNITIGIDVSKDSLDVCIMPSREQHRVANDEGGFRKLYKVVKGREGIFRIVMEHTGGYQKALARYLLDKGLPVSVVNPSKVRHFAKASGIKAKTDAIDAEVLAMFGLAHEPPVIGVRDERSEALRQLVHRKGQLIKMATAEKNRLDKEPCVELRKSSERMLKVLEKELDKITEQIGAIIEADADLRRRSGILQSVKGVGKESAAVLIAEMPELGHIGRRQIASMAGLAPMNRDSGKKKGHAFIQAGRKYARCSLYMPTIVAVRFNPVLKRHYEAMLSRGKPKKLAVTACMRKLLVHLNSLLAKEDYLPTP